MVSQKVFKDQQNEEYWKKSFDASGQVRILNNERSLTCIFMVSKDIMKLFDARVVDKEMKNWGVDSHLFGFSVL